MASWWDTLKAAIRGKGKGNRSRSVPQSGFMANGLLGDELVKIVNAPRTVGDINGGGSLDKS